MHITTVRSHGLRAAEIDLTLVGLRSLLLGPNGSGKSSVMDAIRFAALGHVPALGKADAATAALMHGTRMQVVLTFSDGRTLTRGLRRRGTTLERECRCSWVPEDAGLAEHVEAAAALFGATAEEAAENLDLRSLLGATGPHRTRRLSAMIERSGGPGPAEWADWHSTLTLARLAGVEGLSDGEIRSGALRARRAAWEAGLEGGVAAAYREHGLAAGDLASGPLKAREEAARRRLEAERANRDRVAAAGEMDARLGSMERPPDTVEADLKAASEDAARAVAAAEQAGAAYQRRVAAVRAVSMADQRLVDALAAYDVAVAARDRFHHAEGQPVGPVGPRPTKPPDAPAIDLGAADAKVRVSQRRIARIEAARSKPGLWEEVQAIAGTIRPGYPEEADRLAAIAAENGAVGCSDADVAAAREEAVAAVAALNAARAAHDARSSEIAAWQEAVSLWDSAEREAEAWDRDRRRAEVEVEYGAERVRSCREAADEARRVLAECPAPEDVDTTAERIVQAGARVAAERARVAAAQQYAATRRALAEIRLEIARGDATIAALRASEWAAARVIEIDLSGRSEGLLDVAGRILRAAEIDATPHLGVKRGDVSLGWQRDGAYVVAEAMSAGEYAIFAAALAAAVVQTRGPEVALLLLEGAELDELNAGRLLRGLLEVDVQAILCTWARVPEAHGWSRVHVAAVPA